MFEPIEIEWKGKTYTIDAERQVMRMLAAMQDHVSVAQLMEDINSNGKTANHSRYAGAFAAALNCAGCKVTDIEVYQAMFGEDAANIQTLAMMTINDIYFSLMPSSIGSNKEPAGKKPRAKAKSAPKRKKPAKKTS